MAHGGVEVAQTRIVVEELRGEETRHGINWGQRKRGVHKEIRVVFFVSLAHCRCKLRYFLSALSRLMNINRIFRRLNLANKNYFFSSALKNDEN
jgi:hypothetical protein